MTENELLLKSIKDIKVLNEGLRPYAYNTGEWIEIAVDDYDFYRDNEDFKTISKKIREEFMTNFKIKVIFVYCPYNNNTIKKLKGKEIIQCV